MKKKIELPKELIEPVQSGLEQIIREYIASQPTTRPGKIIRTIVKYIPTSLIIGILLEKLEKK